MSRFTIRLPDKNIAKTFAEICEGQAFSYTGLRLDERLNVIDHIFIKTKITTGTCVLNVHCITDNSLDFFPGNTQVIPVELEMIVKNS
jgi:hypothetical protein